MKDSEGVFGRLKAQGEKYLNQITGELLNNPQFMKAIQTAFRGKEKLDEAVGQALRAMNVPTRTEFKRAVARIDALEREVAGLKQSAAAAAPRRAVAARPKPKRAVVRSKGAGDSLPIPPLPESQAD